jgi:hypothetical protein
MPRAYSVTLDGQSLTAAVTEIITLTAHTNRSCIVTRAWLSQRSNTTSAQQAVKIVRQSASGTSVVTPAINPLDPDDAAAGFTAKGLCTTLGTDTTVQYSDSFNWQNGWLWLPVPEERIVVVGAGILTLKLPVAPAALTISAGLDVIELG